jgi:hypothetical protein
MSVLLPSEFDPVHVSFSQPKTMQNQCTFLYVNYKGGPLNVQLPNGSNKYGRQINPDEKGGPDRHTLTLEYRMGTGDAEVDAIVPAMTALDNVVYDALAKNCRNWLRKPAPPSRDTFIPSLKYPQDKVTLDLDRTANPTMTFKLRTTPDGQYDVLARDPDANEVDLKPLFDAEGGARGSVFTVIASCHVWVVANKCGVKWTAKALLVEAVAPPRATFEFRQRPQLQQQGKRQPQPQPQRRDELAEDSLSDEPEEHLAAAPGLRIGDCVPESPAAAAVKDAAHLGAADALDDLLLDDPLGGDGAAAEAGLLHDGQDALLTSDDDDNMAALPPPPPAPPSRGGASSSSAAAAGKAKPKPRK